MTFANHPHFEWYEGDWKDGVFQGSGYLQLKNGDVYDGEWHRGIKQGTGLYKFTL